MNEQQRVIQFVERGLANAAPSFARKLGIDEDAALDKLRNSPKLLRELQVLSHKSAQKKNIPTKREVKRTLFDVPDPKEYYPSHPQYLPPVVTGDTYNEQMGQNMAAIVHNLVKRIAKDKNLADPNYKAVEDQMKNLDWAHLAYEAKKLGPKPPKYKIVQLFKKLFSPLGKTLDRIPVKYLGLIISAAQIASVVWLTFYQYTEGMADQASKGAVKGHNFLLNRSKEKYLKKFGL